MIPRKIHCCWFGGRRLSRAARRYMAGWRALCPTYDVHLWDESDFDVHVNEYTETCYREGRFAHLSDYARLWIVAHEGGVYLDVDVEMRRPFDALLEHPAFFGFETPGYVNTGLGFGARAGNAAVRAMLDVYHALPTCDYGRIGCPALNTKGLISCGLTPDGRYQDLGVAVVYPVVCFNPYDYVTGRRRDTEQTWSVHHYARSWMSPGAVLRGDLLRPWHRWQGRKTEGGS